MQAIDSLSDLFKQLQCQYRIYDMGRRLSKLSSADFQVFEAGQKPYPLPWLRHAWIGILLWPQAQQTATPKQATPTIWFLKFPLDEQGQLIQASRDEFLNQLLETIGTKLLDQQTAGEWAEQLKHSNLAFTPEQTRMAAFHAHASLALDQSASSYYLGVRAYMASHALDQGWQNLGLQGFADFAVRLPKQADWQQQVAHLPTPVLASLSVQLENQPLNHKLAKAFIERGSNSQDEAEQVACLRAISQSPDASSRQLWLQQLMASDIHTGVEMLATITSKCSSDLLRLDLMGLFVHQCAADQGTFNGLVQELMFQPQLRSVVLEAFRAPQRSTQLIQAIGALMGQSQS